LDFALE
jgi:hypothetical protein